MSKYFKLPLFLSYIGKVFSKAWGQSLSLSQNWLSFSFIVIWALLMAAKAFHLASVIPKLEGILNMDYWMISTMTLGAALVVRLVLAPYWIYKEQKQALDKAQADALEVSNKLALAREQIQTIGEFDVRQIPNTLGEMHNLVRNKIFQEKRKDSYKPEQSLKVMIDILNIDPKSPLLLEDNYTDKQRISHMIKVFRQHMGLKKNNPQKAKMWMHLIVNSLDDNNMGLDLNNNQEYGSLVAKLEKDRRPISTTRLSARIDDFIDALEGLYSIRLLMDYNKTRAYLHLLPDEARELLAELDKKTEAVMNNAMVNVNIPLEAWLVGVSERERKSD
jgi:hypothetical protein